MASSCAVAIAAFLQIVLRISFFIEQSSDVCSTAPTLASWIFLVAFLDILLDICIYPVRYMHLPYICQIVAETIVTILLTEFGLLMVWCTIEKICCKLCKSLLLVIGVTPRFYYNWENYILGTVTTCLSLVILLFVGQATDNFHFMRKRSMRMCRKVNSYAKGTWTKLRSLMAANKCANSDVFEESGAVDCCDMNTDIIYQARRSNNNRRNRSKSRTSRSRNRR
ncbi:uncharacterized protein LOC135956323 [Calliphora vicina]|uniref:uncharacterized protein LOC135956323 n=1 Tax=Calliphora vicina TaxID=7373 RepID=UPI00325B51D7